MAVLQVLGQLGSTPPAFLRKVPPTSCKLVCSLEKSSISKDVSKHLLAGLSASLVLLSPMNKVIAAEQPQYNNICHLAILSDSNLALKLDNETGDVPGMLMMRSMTVQNFDPVRYSGRWFEVASLKRGFAGQGQEDCHCTQREGPMPCRRRDGEDRYRSRGEAMVRGKCFLRFPTLPFIPKEPYDVLATDYDNYAVVSGAKDKSFVQIYSRTPNPGNDFIEKYKNYLADFGYDRDKIRDTPQDCDFITSTQLELMMSMPGMEQALTNQFPELGLKGPVAFDPFSSVFETFKKLVELYFKQLLS